MKFLKIILITSIPFFVFAQSNVVPFTLEDRDRLIKVEENLKSLETKMDIKFDSQNSKFESKFESLQKQIDFTNSLIITMIASLFGCVMYMWWDRRIANVPLKESIEEEKKKTLALLKILKDFAEKNKEFKEVFNNAAIL